MNREKIKDILDTSKISAIDEINILEYIDELEQVKEEYIKSLDKLNIYENKFDKAIEYINNNSQYDDNIDDYWTTTNDLLNILRGEDNE